MRFLLLLFFINFLFVAKGYPFNRSRCVYRGFGGEEVRAGLVNKLVSTLNGGISISQFITSFGDCSAFGESKSERFSFFANNFEHLRSDAARGDGEYLQGASKLLGCDENGHQIFSNLLKANYSKIFLGDQLKNVEDQFEEMESLIFTSQGIRPHCKATN